MPNIASCFSYGKIEKEVKEKLQLISSEKTMHTSHKPKTTKLYQLQLATSKRYTTLPFIFLEITGFKNIGKIFLKNNSQKIFVR